MSQLIVILFLVIAVVRAVTKSKGRGAKPQKPVPPVSVGQEPETADAPEPCRAKARKHVRAAQPEPSAETAGEGYAGHPRRESPSAEPIACGNAQEHSHAHAAEAAVTVDDLRRAVITSEILSKPVSLRDE